MLSRRDFMKSISLTAGATISGENLLANVLKDAENHQIACQQYTWFTYFQREGKEWMNNIEESLNALNKSGFWGYEPSFSNPEEVKNLHSHLKAHKIWSKSMYVNSALHEPELVEQSIDAVLSIAEEAKQIGIEILVTNPTPIRWGGPENKTDKQLQTQALALNVMGKKLKSKGISLAYHNHDAEMRQSAREFHHMLTGTDPEFVKLCLDAHWIYRGSGNSQVALFDIVEMYSDRIVELHLRQSHDGIWSEVFEEGDIDYGRLTKTLREKNTKPHIVLEQATEEGTPYTMDTIEAINKSLSNTTRIFS